MPEEVIETQELEHTEETPAETKLSDETPVEPDEGKLTPEDEAFLDSLSDEEFLKKYEEKQAELKTANKPVDTEVKKEVSVEAEPPETKPAESAVINYKEKYEKLMAPLKANGKLIELKADEDLRTLAQKGSNYVKNMTTIKHARKILQSLDNAGIDEDKLNLLIDAHKGNADAVKTLIKEAKIDPVEIDLDELKYVPGRNIVPDEAVEMSLTINDIKSSPHFEKVKSIISSWDTNSQQLLYSNSSLLKGLHDEVSFGRYDEVQRIVDYEKLMGRLENLSDLDAYVQVVNNYVNSKQQKPVQQQQTPPNIQKPKTVDATLNKKNAMPTAQKGGSVKQNLVPLDLLEMSDEEFARLKLRDLY